MAYLDLNPYVTDVELQSTSGALVSLISASAAGVAAINGSSGVLTLLGTGNVFITTDGQTIIISGSGNESVASNVNTGTLTGEFVRRNESGQFYS